VNKVRKRSPATWPKFGDSLLQACERAYRSGNSLALWDAVVFCEIHNVPKPAWARHALIEYAYSQADALRATKRNGRPSDHHLDSWCFLTAMGWCEEGVSLNRAFEHIQKELEKGVTVISDDGKTETVKQSLSLEAIRASYTRGKRIFAGFGNVGPVSMSFYVGSISAVPPIRKKNLVR
jgi:hypothetical protein